MKKMISYSFIVSLILSSLLMANDQVIPVTSIPKAAKTFLNKYYPSIELVYAEKDRNEIDVTLANGAEVTFLNDGQWKSVDGNNQAIPTGFIPAPVLATIKKSHSGANIIKIEKDFNGFDVKLDNRVELKIDKNGKVYSTEYDD